MTPVHRILALGALLSLPLMAGAADVEARIKNPIALDRPDSVIRLKLADLLKGAPAPAAWDVTAAGMPVPAQIFDGELVLLLNLAPNQERVVKIHPLPNGPEPRVISRVQADMAVRVGGEEKLTKDGHKVIKGGVLEQREQYTPDADHWDHDGTLAHEGPGWESDRVAYRLYLDERAVTDLFAKKRPELVMHNVGRDSNYHVMADWGMDTLEVGESLGDGSFGVLRDGKATQIGVYKSITAKKIANGPVVAGFDIDTVQWSFGDKKPDLDARYLIAAGSRLTEATGRTAPGLPMVAGIVKHKGVELLQPAKPRAWAYLASWGKQSLAGENDLLGMAIFYPVAEISRTGDDGQSLYVLYADTSKPIHFLAGAAWQQELGGITNLEQFRQYLEDTAEALSHPLEVKLD